MVIDSITSSVNPITYEASQGSALNTLLSLLYMNEIKSVTSNYPRLFVSGSCLIL